MSTRIFAACLATTLFAAWPADRGLGAIENITSVDVTTGEEGAPPFLLQGVTVGAYTITTSDMRPGTTEALPGGNDGGNFFNTWPDQENTAAPSDNFDINDILARNMNPNPVLFNRFGGVDQWFDTNGDNPDFFLFEAASGEFGDTDPSIQAILPGGALGNVVNLPDTGEWGDTGFDRVGNPNGGQNLTGISFAVTDLLDASGSPLTNDSMIEGIQVNSMGVDPSTLAAVMIGIEPLSIEVDTSSGEIMLRNNNQVWPISEEMAFYRIESPSGSLSTSGWNSLDEQNIDAEGAGGLGDGWDESGGANAAGISELRLTGGTTLAPNDAMSLGNAFSVGGGGNLLADFDENGVTDGADQAIFDANFGNPAGPTTGDANGDGLATGDDFLILQREFGSTGGGGGQQDLTFVYATPSGLEVQGLVQYIAAGNAQGVPEPGSLGLAACIGGLFGGALLRRKAARGSLVRLGVVVLTVVALTAASASAALVNKYNFNDGTASDSVGTAHGEIVDPSNISFFAGGQLSLTENNGAPSGQDYALDTTTGAYVDLPNGLFNSAATGGTLGQVSVEVWLTVETNRSSARVLDFGSQNDGDGEDQPTGGANMQSYVALQPQAGDQVLLQMRKGDPDVSYSVGASPPLEVGVEHHLAFVLDDLDFLDLPDGRASLYVDGALVASGTLPPFPFLDGASINDVNNWIGRSQFAGNPLFDGLVNEVRIHDAALSAGDVATSFSTGPDPGPPSIELIVNRETGEVSLANSSAGSVPITGYTISSAQGGLDAAGFTSVNDGGSFDPDGTWTTSSAESTEISEAESTAGDGGTVAVSDSFDIGAVWRQTPFQDLLFQYSVSGGGVESGFVQYTGDAVARSDLNGDGEINIDDWGALVENNYADLSTLSLAEAYQHGDLDGDLDNDKDDFFLFRGDFIAANGAEAFAALQGVPEPASYLLAALGLACLTLRRRWGRQS